MKILVDENIPNVSTAELRRLGHDVKDIRGTALQGLPDEELWNLALQEQRMFITTDKGFAAKRSEDHYGVLIIRLRQPSEQTIHVRVISGVKHFTKNEWRGLLVVIRDTVQSTFRT